MYGKTDLDKYDAKVAENKKLGVCDPEAKIEAYQPGQEFKAHGMYELLAFVSLF